MTVPRWAFGLGPTGSIFPPSSDHGKLPAFSRGATMADMRTEPEKLLAGDWYLGPDPEFNALQNAARERLRQFNDTPRSDPGARIVHQLDPARCCFGDETGRR